MKCDETRSKCRNCIRIGRVCIYAERKATYRRSLRNPRFNAKTTFQTSSPSPRDVTSVSRHSSRSIEDDVRFTKPNSSSTISHNVVQPFHTILEDGKLVLDELVMLSPNNIKSSRPNSVHGSGQLAQAATTRAKENPVLRSESLYTTNNPSEVKALREPCAEPWNTRFKIELTHEETTFFEHYITTVGPILDLFDPAHHFTNMVPHIALHNVGLLKSILSVGAFHLALHPVQCCANGGSLSSNSPRHFSSDCGVIDREEIKIAEGYYSEALKYLAENISYETYTASDEILATVIMVSTYEMYRAHAGTNGSNSNWDQHLKDAFWIQRHQGSGGETSDGLRHAVWYAWIRQDIWAALCQGRPTLTIWQPKKALSDLSTVHLTERILFLTAKCVKFAANQKKGGDITGYIQDGQDLLRVLNDWRELLPPSFDPIPCGAAQTLSETTSSPRGCFRSIWIHPPSHAAAIQMYHFARIIILLYQPTLGGVDVYHVRNKMLQESIETICGIAIGQQSQHSPGALVSFQTVYMCELVPN